MRIGDSSAKPGEPAHQHTYSPVRCPSPGCREIYFDLPSGSYVNPLEHFNCPQCGGNLPAIFSSLSENDPRVIYVQFRCETCNKNYTFQTFAMRRYCHGCKQVYQVFVHGYLLPPDFKLPASESP